MKRVIKFTSVFLIILLLLTNSTFTQKVNTSIKAIPIKELDTLPIERTYSYEEILTHAENGDYEIKDIEEFKKNHEENLKLQSPQENRTTIRYSIFAMDGIKFKGKYYRTYHIQPQVIVGLLYSGSSSPDKIVSLESSHVYTENGSPTTFDGNITCKLISGREIFILMQGRAYKHRKGNSPREVKISIGGIVQAYATFTNNGYLKDISYDETYYSDALDR
ncbi:MAG: hypothetical protein AB2417_17955 [Clostridiaceae bacterium]